MMWPPTQIIAAMPTTDRVLSSLGIAATRPRPIVAWAPDLPGEVEADVVHLDDEGDDAVDERGDGDRDDGEDRGPQDEPLVLRPR